MSSNSTFDDIEEEVSSWGYSMSVSDYERSLIEESPKAQIVSFPRGRGITDSNYISNVKLASELNGIVEKAAPLGHLLTTKEVLNEKDVNEITPLLRMLGISGHDGQLSSENTRAVCKMENDIRIEGNVPIILNGDLFAMIDNQANVDKSDEVDEPYDPKRPLHEQFSTIKEFAVEKELKNAKLGKFGARPKSPSNSSLSSFSQSSHSPPASDGSSSCTSSSSSVTNFSVSEQNSNDDFFEPLLNIKPSVKLYTPRQLYEMKRKGATGCLQKGRPMNGA